MLHRNFIEMNIPTVLLQVASFVSVKINELATTLNTPNYWVNQKMVVEIVIKGQFIKYCDFRNFYTISFRIVTQALRFIIKIFPLT